MRHVPIETVRSIIAELACSNDSTPNVRSCTLVCRSWGHICQETLFHTLNPGDESALSLARLIYIALHLHPFPTLSELVRKSSAWHGSTHACEARAAHRRSGTQVGVCASLRTI
jgi:hypothetical protein